MECNLCHTFVHSFTKSFLPMRNSLFALLAFAAMFASLGCPSPKPPDNCAIQFGLNESFTLNQGIVACSKDMIGFTIGFDSVAGDSRCPVGVQCIWAGRADVVLTLAHGAASESVTLASGDMSQGGKGEAVFHGYTVKLENVEPPKEQGRNIEQKDYKVRLVVTK